MPEPTLNETMHDYAEEMVKLARDEFHIDLDFSLASTEHIEPMMDAYVRDPEKARRIGRLGDEARRRENLMEMVDSAEQDRARDWLRQEEIAAGRRRLAVTAGAYAGEVIRRRWGGEWRQNGGARLRVLDQDLNPGGLVYFRLTEGPRHNLTDYFKRVVGQLVLAEPGPVQQQAQPSWTQDRIEIATPRGPFVLHGLKLEKDAGGRLVISGSVTNGSGRAWKEASFTVELFDTNGTPVPIELEVKKTLRAKELAKGETKALTDMIGRSPLALGRFSQGVVRFRIVLNSEHCYPEA